MDIIKKISEELEVKGAQVQAAVELLDEGCTVPFIARYRKEKTGALKDEQLLSDCGISAGSVLRLGVRAEQYTVTLGPGSGSGTPVVYRITEQADIPDKEDAESGQFYYIDDDKAKLHDCRWNGFDADCIAQKNNSTNCVYNPQFDYRSHEHRYKDQNRSQISKKLQR